MIRTNLTAGFLILVMAATQPVRSQQEEPKPSAAEVRKEISEAIDAIERYSVAKRDEALQRARQALADLDEDLEKREARLRERWSAMSKEARQRADETEAELTRRRRDLAEWYGALKHGSQNAWDELKKGFASAYGEFKKAWQNSGSDPVEDKI